MDYNNGELFSKIYKQELLRIESRLKNLLKSREPKSLYDPCSYVLEAGGKRLRPFLVMLSAKAVNSNPKDVTNAALAVELLHNFTLVHDDIMDNSDKRRGRLTLHKKYDMSTAILAGDNLIALAYECLLRDCKDDAKKVISTFNHGIIEVCEGQSLDKEFEIRSNVTLPEYLGMIYKKTAALAEMCCSIGAQLGGGSKEQVKALSNFGKNLGMAFQIQDDLLDITAEENEFGKPVGGDLVEGKKTFLFLTAMNIAKGKEKQMLMNVIKNKGIKKEDVYKYKELYEQLGILANAKKEIIRYTKLAVNNLKKLQNNEGMQMLNQLAVSLTGRNK